ncbi:MAG: Gfo/Idh/MocA family oxidoreductase [Bacteroidota bacterium]|nr:Gfo/Idh/MocA family oxidoreductase [Bacteroidota bacterium]MDE2834477.1 Gfo/Idh/MocA family oxidoreductase [Bacteroidota bacterium]
MDTKNRPASWTRRDFVKGGTAAVVGSAVASQFPLKASAYYGVDDTIRVGLIGCGGRGTGAAVQALQAAENVQLVAMCDAFMDRVEESYGNIVAPENSDPLPEDVLARVQVPKEHMFDGFDGYQKVLPLVDVVILTTPPGFRPVHFDAAVEAGKQVFMEKPLATDAPGVRQILATGEKARARKLNVVVGLQRHYQTVYREWVSRLHADAIGDIILGRVYWNGGGVWVRDRASLEEEAQRKITEMEYQMRNWYYFNWLCGDHIVEQHIHNIDVGNWVMKGHPVRAQGQGGRLVRTGMDHGEIYDHHFVEFEYASGARVLSQCRHMPDCMNRVSEGFHGSRGAAPSPGEIIGTSGNVIYKHRDKDDPNPYQVEHDELFAAINAGEFKYEDTQNGAEATMSSIMGRMATYTGQVITWEDAINDDVQLVPDKLAWDVDPPVMPDKHGRYKIPLPGVAKPDA